MSLAAYSQIIRVSTGKLNTVNDTVVGGQSNTGMAGTQPSKFGGQLGKWLVVTSEQVAQMYSSTIGTLYGGIYQYVQLATGDTTPVVGQGLFWQGTPSDFIVSSDSNGGFTNTGSVAGIYLGGFTAGNYGFIQTAGIATVKYKSGLTVAAATGLPIIIASTGLADTNAGTNVPNFIGWARTLPVSNDLALVNLSAILSRQF
jgi:hypothetical protein